MKGYWREAPVFRLVVPLAQAHVDRERVKVW
jgi:hypothetical protein